MKKVLGMGNALVDVLIRIDRDELLHKLELPKGSMQLVDGAFVNKLLEATNIFPVEIASGGSAANTIHGLASLGVPCGYIGKIGEDEFGKRFLADMQRHHVEAQLMKGLTDTGRSIALISPDTERTFATFLGAAIELLADDLTPELFNGYDYFHIEGYLVQNHDLIEKAVSLAKKADLTISLDLASFNVVEANLDFLKKIIRQYVNIVFANEEEARSFTGFEPEKALIEIANMCDIAVVKIGKKGSLIMSGQHRYEVNAVPVNSIDTTGAGDLYAAGFLYGLMNNLSLDVCGEIGSLTAGNIIEVIGARMGEDRWEKIRDKIAAVVKE